MLKVMPMAKLPHSQKKSLFLMEMEHGELPRATPPSTVRITEDENLDKINELNSITFYRFVIVLIG